MTKTFSSITIGAIGATIVALGSYGGGATRYRGGVVDSLGLSSITFGHAYSIFETLIWVGLLFFCAGWVWLGREVFTAQADFARVKKALLTWLVPLALSGPIFSRDVYSYLMQGAMVRDGFDPYTEGAAVNPGPMLLEVSADWRNTTTPYGPLHLGLGDWITSIVGDNIPLGIIVYRAICVLGFAAIWWSIPKIAQKLGGSPTMALWLGVANPLVMLHLIGGLHNEAMMVGLVSLAILAQLHFKTLPGTVIAAVLVGVGVSLKATAIIALPFLVWIALTRKQPIKTLRDALRRSPALIGIGVLLVAIAIATLAVITVVTGTSWGWISELSGNTKVINPLAAPSAVAGLISAVTVWFNDDLGFNAIVEVTRKVSSVIMVLGLVLSWIYFRRTPRQNMIGMIVAYIVACLFNAVALPWYYASLLTPMGTIRPPRWALQATVLFTLILSLSFAGGGNHRFYDIPWMIIVTAVAWLATGWLTNGEVEWKYPWKDRTVKNGSANHDSSTDAPAESTAKAVEA